MQTKLLSKQFLAVTSDPISRCDRTRRKESDIHPHILDINVQICERF